jgi:DNA-binding transcriptional MerR regulator
MSDTGVPVTEPTTVSTEALARDLGVSYRRIDYWVRRGYLAPEGDPTPGTGSVRAFGPEAVRRARSLVRLIRAGLAPAAAARALDAQRALAIGGGYLAPLADGLSLIIDEPDDEGRAS